MKKILLSSALYAELAALSVSGEHGWEFNGILDKGILIFTQDFNKMRNSKAHYQCDLKQLKNKNKLIDFSRVKKLLSFQKVI